MRGARNYHPLPIVLVRGEGVYLWDDEGKNYLDMMSAYSAVSFGHAHPRLVNALTEQAQRLAVVSRAYHTDQLPLFLEKICRLTGQDRALPMNTGAEAARCFVVARCGPGRDTLSSQRSCMHKVNGSSCSARRSRPFSTS